tara:strand:- start:1323 stop:2507 length:1185 start_codon:yes stop_codon:yes gene_type:complete
MKIYNTQSKTIEEFSPAKKEVGMYVCGPTVYSESHLGHAKSYVAFDILRRWIEYNGHPVMHVQNITDVSDETAQTALKFGKSEKEITEEYTEKFKTQMRTLGNLEPRYTPKASEYVEKIAEITKDFLNIGKAYETEEGVYLKVESKNHGKLLGSSIDEAIVEIGVNTGPKRSPYDFMLWGPELAGGETWNIEGLKPGRPGWHSGCVMMASSILKMPLDIHCGGVDLIYPHHESEIIISECVFEKEYCNFWVHNGLMEDAEGKLSKSGKQRLTLSEIFKKYEPMQMRFYLLGHHYRENTPFDIRAFEKACEGYQKLNRIAKKSMTYEKREIESALLLEILEKMENSMNDDLNTPAVIDLIREVDRMAKERLESESEMGQISSIYSLFKKTLGIFL